MVKRPSAGGEAHRHVILLTSSKAARSDFTPFAVLCATVSRGIYNLAALLMLSLFQSPVVYHVYKDLEGSGSNANRHHDYHCPKSSLIAARKAASVQVVMNGL